MPDCVSRERRNVIRLFADAVYGPAGRFRNREVQTSDFVKLKFPASWTSGTKRTLLESWQQGSGAG
ncbi:MAG TPA: hypothetical protein DCK99_01105, partial [Blastocatellia bacterium]|nr:hypothetical protein [Blastocatellia bacterium]